MKKWHRNIISFICFPFQKKVDVVVLVILFLTLKSIVGNIPLKHYYKLLVNTPNCVNDNLQPNYENLNLIKKVIKKLPGNYSCLVESITTKLFIKIKEDIDIPIFVGVQRNPSGLKAHAWNFGIVENEFIKITIGHEG